MLPVILLASFVVFCDSAPVTASSEASQRFENELKVFEGILNSDGAFLLVCVFHLFSCHGADSQGVDRVQQCDCFRSWPKVHAAACSAHRSLHEGIWLAVKLKAPILIDDY